MSARQRKSARDTPEKNFAYFPPALILASFISGCEKVHVDRFARTCTGSGAQHAPDDYAMTEPTNVDNAFMARAIQLAVENVRSGRGGPFGCVVVRAGNIVAEAANQVTATNDPTAHAEMLAIRQACQKLRAFELKDCDLYTSCEPCPMCLSAIYWARIDQVYFGSLAEDAAKAGFDDSAIYGEIAKPLAQRKLPMIQTMRQEAQAAFRAWQENPGKILY